MNSTTPTLNESQKDALRRRTFAQTVTDWLTSSPDCQAYLMEFQELTRGTPGAESLPNFNPLPAKGPALDQFKEALMKTLLQLMEQVPVPSLLMQGREPVMILGSLYSLLTPRP